MVAPVGTPAPERTTPPVSNAGSAVVGLLEKAKLVLPTATVEPFMSGDCVVPVPLNVIVVPEIEDTVTPGGIPVPKILAPTISLAGSIAVGVLGKDNAVLPTAIVTPEVVPVAFTPIVIVFPDTERTVAPNGIPGPNILTPGVNLAGSKDAGGLEKFIMGDDAASVAVGDITPVEVAVGDINPVELAVGVMGIVVELGAIPKLQFAPSLHKLLTVPTNLLVGILFENKVIRNISGVIPYCDIL